MQFDLCPKRNTAALGDSSMFTLHYLPMCVWLSADPALHHHAARAAGAHSSGPRGEEVAGARQEAARDALQADARRGKAL